jgi:hypothetical protein
MSVKPLGTPAAFTEAQARISGFEDGVPVSGP